MADLVRIADVWHHEPNGSAAMNSHALATNRSSTASNDEPLGGAQPRRHERARCSANINVVAFGLTPTTFGMIEASMTRKPPTPRTAPAGSTTASGSSSGPILQVPVMWWLVDTDCCTHASRAASSASTSSNGATRSATIDAYAG